jgi:hypothetical protein
MKRTLAVVALGFAIAGCPSSPKKEQAITALTAFAEAVERQDFDAATPHLRVPKDVPIDDVKESLREALAAQEISVAGVKRLAAEGTWGKYADVFPENERVDLAPLDVPASSAWGLRLGDAQVGLYWDGAQFLIFRCSGVGSVAAPQ